MNHFEQYYLELSLNRLKDILPSSPDSLMMQYKKQPDLWSVEQIKDQVFCLFDYVVPAGIRQIILLVYDSRDRIIADIGAYHMSARSFLEDTDVYDYLSEESDWLYLEHYVLSNTVFQSFPYPYCLQNKPAEINGHVLLYTNAYVSFAFRRRGIFRTMVDTVKQHALQSSSGIQKISSVMSMDPDIACYGPDALDEPYYYSYEKDEPVRRQNAEIARKIGFSPIKLEPDNPEIETDGTKLWFCICNEFCDIIDTTEPFQ